MSLRQNFLTFYARPDSAGPAWLYGVEYQHYEPAGYFVKDGEIIGVTCFRATTDLLDDTPILDGAKEPNESIDMQAVIADDLVSPDAETVDPSTYPRFLGWTVEDIKQRNPDAVFIATTIDPETEEPQAIEMLRKCSWEDIK